MRIAIIIAVFGLAACQPPPQTEISQVAAPASATQTSGGIGAMLNTTRARHCRGAVTQDARLSRAAGDHAQDMVENGYFSHDSPSGTSFLDRAQAAGYACASAENIAFGQQNEAELMTAWMGSAGHRVNILQESATEFGIGRSGNMWVLMMGRGC